MNSNAQLKRRPKKPNLNRVYQYSPNALTKHEDLKIGTYVIITSVESVSKNNKFQVLKVRVVADQSEGLIYFNRGWKYEPGKFLTGGTEYDVFLHDLTY